MNQTTGLVAQLHDRRGAFDLDVELEVAAGETLALLGPNGAGKSTIVELLAGHRSLRTEGCIRLGRTVLDEPAGDTFVPPERRRVATVYQQHLLFEHMTARANVAFGLRAAGHGRRPAERRAAELLELFGIGELGDRRPAQLSGGQAQRVAIARAVAVDPALLLFDEPLAALDVETRTGVRRTLRDHLAAVEVPAILISHEPADALLLADRIAVVEHGRITQVGTPEEVRRHPTTSYVAALAGTNLVRGRAATGEVVVDGVGETHRLRVADTSVDGPVVCTIRPEAVSLHREPPTGSQRNVWPTIVDDVEELGDRARVTVGAPLPLAVDVTPSAVRALGVEPGVSVWLAVKATEVSVRRE
ncbi:MAG: ABC transporter ATP-binding protein [Actinomycetota bacterium]